MLALFLFSPLYNMCVTPQKCYSGGISLILKRSINQYNLFLIEKYTPISNRRVNTEKDRVREEKETKKNENVDLGLTIFGVKFLTVFFEASLERLKSGHEF